ncbi:hypothetical protein ES332_D05G149700v1 [Gossypium tomentosum]|uniref:Uncharacterized protein n=1 Tax=Gossypium tomentosum TaxID=34277 RepID=A0A5D2KVY7_GOSTO|nr:hypothetical protein ES332_D05G149700v1 [Gossypium tomentosum]
MLWVTLSAFLSRIEPYVHTYNQKNGRVNSKTQTRLQQPTAQPNASPWKANLLFGGRRHCPNVLHRLDILLV